MVLGTLLEQRLIGRGGGIELLQDGLLAAVQMRLGLVDRRLRRRLGSFDALGPDTERVALIGAFDRFLR